MFDTFINFFSGFYNYIRPILWLVIIVVIACVLYLKRRELPTALDRLRNSRLWYNRMEQSSLFEGDLESGLSSGNFDLSGNLAGDSRKGLDENAKAEIRNIMDTQNVSFDEARLRYFQSSLSNNGVGSDGVPTDRRTVTFDRFQGNY